MKGEQDRSAAMRELLLLSEDEDHVVLTEKNE